MGCEPVTTQAGLWAVGVLVFLVLGIGGVAALLAVGAWLGPLWISFLSLSGGSALLAAAALANELARPDSERAHLSARAAAAVCAVCGVAAIVGLSSAVDEMALASCSLEVACGAAVRTASQCGERVAPFYFCYGPSRRLDGLSIDWGDDGGNATGDGPAYDDDDDDDDDDDGSPSPVFYGDDAGGPPGHFYDDDWVAGRGVAGLSAWVHDDCVSDSGGADDACYAFASPRDCAEHRFADAGTLGDDDCDLGKSPRDLADLMARVATIVVIFFSGPSLGLAYFSRRRQLRATIAVAPAVAEASPLPPLPVAAECAAPPERYRVAASRPPPGKKRPR